MMKVTDISPNMGCDPEFFFKHKGLIIGAEKIIPQKGLVIREKAGNEIGSKFIIDGVQAEINPRPNTCRANLANELRRCMIMLKQELLTKGADYTADFSRTIEISKDELMSLDEKSRKFGCAPSNSIYKTKAGIKITDVDPTEYRTRAAGGHIHIGTNAYYPGLNRALTKDYERTVQMLDLLCGNTAVLVDRDEGNIERRKVYGKAGEFRLPPHGLEYRTLSNFWLTAYPLMSFAFGMARLAVCLMSDTDEKRATSFFEAFMGKVKPKYIHTAINNNDFDLATENFQAIEQLMLDVTYKDSDRFAIHGGNIKEFYHFVSTIHDKGLGYWFKQDPMEHWTTIPECHTGGFSDYLRTLVREDMKEVLKKRPKETADYVYADC